MSRSFLAAIALGACLASLSFLLGACGGVGPSPGAGQPVQSATTRSAPTIDLVAKNLTATAYRPTVVLVTPIPTVIGTPGTFSTLSRSRSVRLSP